MKLQAAERISESKLTSLGPFFATWVPFVLYDRKHVGIFQHQVVFIPKTLHPSRGSSFFGILGAKI